MPQTLHPAQCGQCVTPCSPPSSVSAVWAVADAAGGTPGGRGGEVRWLSGVRPQPQLLFYDCRGY